MAILKETPHGDIGPDIADDEAICPVTNLTYLAALGTSPYLDTNGKVWI